MVPVLVQLVGVEVGGELRSVGRVGREVGRREVVQRRALAMRGGGRRNYTERTMET